MNAVVISRHLLLSVMLFAACTLAAAEGTVERIDPTTFSYDERLQYTVTYLGIRIGTVEILNKVNETNIQEVEETVITLRTFSGIPFLSVYTEFYSKRGSDGYFTESITFDRERSKWAYYNATRNENTTDVIVDRGYKNRDNGEIFDVEVDTLYPGEPIHDALTFISILRDSAHTGRPYELDILIDRSVEKINIEAPEDREEIEVRAFSNEAEAYHINGVIDFTAIHGLSRKYQAWITTDNRRIPLKARVRIAIGSVKIELEEYENNR